MQVLTTLQCTLHEHPVASWKLSDSTFHVLSDNQETGLPVPLAVLYKPIGFICPMR